MNARCFLRRIVTAVFLACLTGARGASTGTETDTRVWTREAGYRWTALSISATETNGFLEVPASSSGVRFTNVLDEVTGAANRVLYNGAGTAVGDVDGDGRPDLFFCQLSGHNALYRNLGGFRFEDVTGAAGLGEVLPFTRGAVLADVDGDGDLDLLVTVTGRGALCFLNDGAGRFTEATVTAGLGARTGSTSLALADIDGNGTLDLYVTNYRPDDIRDRGRVNLQMINGRPVLRGAETNRFVMLSGRLEECGQPDQLYLNDGKGHFAPVSWTSGAFLDEAGEPLKEPPPDWGLTATFRDVNGDGAPDLYVCNDYWTPDRFWLNDGRGRFRAIASPALRKTPASSMSVDFADVDRDGYLDFFVVDMLSRYPALRKRQGFAQMLRWAPPGGWTERQQVMRNTLFRNRGDTTYTEIAAYAHLAASDWSWSPVFLDVDLDGYEDLLVGAGHFRDVQDYDAEAQVQARQRSWTGFSSDAERQKAFTKELMEHYRLYPKLEMPLGAFRNRGDLTFEETTETWGLGRKGVHQGIATADFDGDGLVDLAVNNLNEGASLYRHTARGGRVAVRLKGRAPNTQAIGANVTLLGGAVPRQSVELIAGGRYQSGCDPLVMLATGAAGGPMSLEVRWRDGGTTRLTNVVGQRLYEIDEASVARLPAGEGGRKSTIAGGVASPATAWFEDVSGAVGHRHVDPEYNDLERQPLLPFKLSQGGPGLGWFDFDDDGREDLVVGAGRGGQVAFLHNDGGGRFTPRESTGAPVPDDAAGVAGWVSEDGTRRVLVGVTGYEAKVDSALLNFGMSAGGVTNGAAWGSGMAGAGAVALGDPEGNGRLMLFAGGGVVAGQYPTGAPSRLFRATAAGGWEADTRNSVLLENLGIVNGAVWTDLDGDGRAELVLACEWGPIRVFRARAGAFAEVTRDVGLDGITGWWRGVTSVDVDGDGRMDLVASNWGLNSTYRASVERPLTLVYGELAQPGVMDLLETEYVGATLAPSRQLPALAGSLPFLLERFPSAKAYSEATLEQVLGDRSVLARRVGVTTLESMVFLNTGGRFRAVPLPAEAQWAPAFGVAVADFDGDGVEDLFLAQNFSPVHPEVTALDAGLGLCLRGTGTERFEVLSAARSGVVISGDQRGAAVADIDGDGRVDLAVAQNGGATRLFRNRVGTPGLRVRLQGPPGNRLAYGAVMRTETGGRAGPAREIHGGSGYWSQDGAVTVLAMPKRPEAVRVRWPGGRETRVEVPAESKELTIGLDGLIPPRK